MSNLTIYAYSLVTVAVFFIALKINARLKSAILNPFILGLLMLIGILLISKIPHQQFYQGNLPLNNLLNVSVVALAVPFYEQLPQIRKHWKKIMLVVTFGTLVSILTGLAFALLFGASQEIAVSSMPKSVSMAIALAISTEMGGTPALTAVGVMIAGIGGSALGVTILQLARIQGERAMGLAMGAVSHALGTARIMELSSKSGSYGSLALVLCGLLSSIVAPLIFRFASGLF